MTGYKTILACLSDAETAPATLGLGLLIARQHDCHIEALHVRGDPAATVPLVGEGMSGAMVEEMLLMAERQETERAAVLHQQFDEACRLQKIDIIGQPPAGLSAAWRDEMGREEEVIADIGRLSDMVVMARPLPDRDVPSVMSLNAALMESGRPLMLAPPTLPAGVGRSVAIFWNGSAEASRAVAASLPFLHRAERVAILSAREENAAAPGELASYLAWHGVHAGVHTFGAGSHVGQALLDEAAAQGADLIVMGAYTHSRLRQLILGGVTRHVLHSANLPVLLSH